MDDLIRSHRRWLKDSIRKTVDWSATGQSRGLPMDVGHVCQNLYLSAEAIGAGVCAVAAYDQEALDALLHLDGEEEFVIYLAPVGKHAISA